MKKNKLKIMMTGGGSGGPVSPLLAIVDYLREKYPEKYSFVWVGTTFGPEKKMVAFKSISFKEIVSGKWRRYFSLENFIDIFKIVYGFVESIVIIRREKPSLVMSAGGFVSVPVVYAAKLMRIPILIHQQDVLPGLANKLMAPLAKVVTVTFEKSLKDYRNKSIWTGNPVGHEIKLAQAGACHDKLFEFNDDSPLVVILGGGTGALRLNQLIKESIGKLGDFCQIFHQTGQGKDLKIKHPNYHSREFIDARQLAYILFRADVVISRCGLGTLTELSYLGKAAILVPMPNSHQEYNANIFKENKAAVILEEKNIDVKIFVREIKELLKNKAKAKVLSKNIKKIIRENAEEKITKEIIKILSKK